MIQFVRNDLESLGMPPNFGTWKLNTAWNVRFPWLDEATRSSAQTNAVSSTTTEKDASNWPAHNGSCAFSYKTEGFLKSSGTKRKEFVTGKNCCRPDFALNTIRHNTAKDSRQFTNALNGRTSNKENGLQLAITPSKGLAIETQVVGLVCPIAQDTKLRAIG